MEKKEDGTFTVHLEGGDPIEADAVLMATGRPPNTKGLGLEEAGVALDDKGAIKVDERNQSSPPSIFAVGDVTDRIQLTPVAIRAGHAFADPVFGDTPPAGDYSDVHSSVFSPPPTQPAGMT